MTRGRPARALVLRGETARNHEAASLTTAPGEAAIVRRARMRSIVIACPDGCGDHITVNLDQDAGPAWKLYRRARGLTLFPSVWRESGCRSHFIVWNDTILWCETYADGNREPESTAADLNLRVLDSLSFSFQSYVDIAASLDEIPWEVARSCRSLTGIGIAEEAAKPHRGQFRRLNSVRASTGSSK